MYNYNMGQWFPFLGAFLSTLYHSYLRSLIESLLFSWPLDSFSKSLSLTGQLFQVQTSCRELQSGLCPSPTYTLALKTGKQISIPRWTLKLQGPDPEAIYESRSIPTYHLDFKFFISSIWGFSFLLSLSSIFIF